MVDLIDKYMHLPRAQNGKRKHHEKTGILYNQNVITCDFYKSTLGTRAGL